MSVEIRERGGAVCFAVRVQPRASREGYAGEWNGALKIRLTAAPVDNRANDDCAVVSGKFERAARGC